MRLFVFFIKFMFLAAFFIISNGDLHLIVQEERQQFYDEYQGWVFGVASSLGEVTGYLVKVEWLPGENTPADNSESSSKVKG